MRARGVPMCALCEPPDPVQARQVAVHPAPSGRGDLASAGCGSRAGETPAAARRARYRILAAGAAVAVALCLSLAGTIPVMPVRAMPVSHVVRTMAVVRFAGDSLGCPPLLGRGGGMSSLIGRIPLPGRGSAGHPHRLILASQVIALH
jgi:hypothetical protein